MGAGFTSCEFQIQFYKYIVLYQLLSINNAFWGTYELF